MDKKYKMMPIEMPSVTTTELTRGHSPKILRDVFENNFEVLVMKNNKPLAVIVSYQEFMAMKRGIKNEK